jgi:hypothetical protein
LNKFMPMFKEKTSNIRLYLQIVNPTDVSMVSRGGKTSSQRQQALHMAKPGTLSLWGCNMYNLVKTKGQVESGGNNYSHYGNIKHT